jgi:hypothetical protein
MSLSSLNNRDEVFFKEQCLHKLSQYPDLYAWMDPMLITTDVSVGTLCENLGDLYRNMNLQYNSNNGE